MVEILEVGPAWSLETVCTGKGNGNKGCGTKLKLERDDMIYFSEREGYCRIYEAAVIFKCPCCYNITDIAKKRLAD